jgi:hypothetical protein
MKFGANPADEDSVQTLAAVIIPRGIVVSRWRPTHEEMTSLLEDGEIFLSVWKGEALLQPMLLEVMTPDEMAERHALATKAEEERQEKLAESVRQIKSNGNPDV